jgi:hypothetical protein
MPNLTESHYFCARLVHFEFMPYLVGFLAVLMHSLLDYIKNIIQLGDETRKPATHDIKRHHPKQITRIIPSSASATDGPLTRHTLSQSLADAIFEKEVPPRTTADQDGAAFVSLLTQDFSTQSQEDALRYKRHDRRRAGQHRRTYSMETVCLLISPPKSSTSTQSYYDVTTSLSAIPIPMRRKTASLY